LRLTHVEGAVLAAGCASDAVRRVHDALALCLEHTRVCDGSADVESVCAALASCKAHALLVASAELGDLEPRTALALIAGMPARGGPDLIAFEREGRADLRLALFRSDALARVRAQRALADCASALDALLVPATWL